MSNRYFAVAAVGALLVCVGEARGGVIHNESVNGDLSNDWLSPTTYVLPMGSSTVSASSVAAGNGEREYLRLDVPAGMFLTNINVVAFTGGTNLAFIAVNPGTTMINPVGATAPMLSGYTHFGGAHIGTDLMAAISTGPGAAGFTPPLASGSYTFWIQETSLTLASTYTLEFRTVPSPGVGAAGLVGLAILGARRRR